jgi:methylthioribose-1-phosphate isomerase
MRRTGLRLQTHCNAGALACVDFGTALGVVRVVHERGRLDRVYVDESRPLLQGARLTAWELDQFGADYRVVVDGAGPSLIARGLVDAVIVGADRVAANGDVANKIGTYPLALAAGRSGVPFVVAAPESTVDPATADGAAIVIEDRDDAEVLTVAGRPTAPAAARAVNPAFDVTPADLVTAIVTERRVVRPAAGERPA